MELQTFLVRTRILLLLLGLVPWPRIHASYTPSLTQSFFFNYSAPSQLIPVPITTQCETIRLTWERGEAPGPEPIAPYFLQIYTSTFTFPFTIEAGSGKDFDWAVPFAPGTQYQICMFDSNGSTGGCQAIYTVIPPMGPELPVCQNVTFPGSLDVEASTANGPLYQFGWVDQCTDIAVSPMNGTPPYTLTVAPALHPPYNISVNEKKSMAWTVSLSQAFPFFISVVDSQGHSWANGPLHSAGDQSTNRACLALGDVSSETWVGPSLAVGVGVGGLVIGSLIGIASAYLFMKHRRRKELRGAFVHISSASPLVKPIELSPPDSTLDSTCPQYRRISSVILPVHTQDPSLASSSLSSNNDALILNRLTRGRSKYYVEPFAMPTEDGRRRTAPEHGDSSHESSVLSSSRTQTSASVSGSTPSQNIHQVYPRSDALNHQRGESETEALISGTDEGQVNVAQDPLGRHQHRKPRKLSKQRVASSS